MTAWIIENGIALVGGELLDQEVFISGTEFSSRAGDGAERFDATDCYVMPGIVDVHGDGFERVIEPRPGVTFDKVVALWETDRQLIANGITTAFHGLGVSWEPGLRSIHNSIEFAEKWAEMKDRLSCQTFLNIRWENYALDHTELVGEWLSAFPGSVLSVNDHTTPFAGLEPDHPRIARAANRMGVAVDEYVELLHKLFSRSAEVPGATHELCKTATELGSRIFAHDEMRVDQREEHRSMGMTVSEFPMSIETAQAAIQAGEEVIMGAPNVVRGGSQNGALCAAQAISSGACNVLASDYYYPAQLRAAFVLVEKGLLRLEDAWRLVSENPARAVGLSDRGIIQDGYRADLAIVSASSNQIVATFANGNKVYEGSESLKI